MLEKIPIYIPIVFGLVTAITLFFLLTAIKKSSLGHKAHIIGGGLFIWLSLQMILSYNLFYINTVKDIPPKFAIIGFLPTFLFMIFIFNTKKGKTFIDSLSLYTLTILSIIRIPVEIVLWWLFLHNTIPELMTFEGRNFDILAGISAPFVAYYGYKKENINAKFLLLWNIISLLLLINIVVFAMLSFPTTFQQFAFLQPNMAILYFPFFWLPSFVVPVVLFTHFVSIRRLIQTPNTK